MNVLSKFEVSVDLDRMVGKSQSAKYQRPKYALIISYVCALLNSNGGSLRINIQGQNEQDFEENVDGFLRATEQHLRKFIPLCKFNELIRMPQLQDGQFVYEVDPSPEVFTLRYHLCLPTQKQVEEVSPSDSPGQIRDILTRNAQFRGNFSTRSPCEYFEGDRAPLTESDSVQFKFVKAKKSKCVSIADRMISESNKLDRCISAFGNKVGGFLLFGIRKDGIVKGEKLTEADKVDIERKVTKVFRKMIWLNGQMEKGKHWNIDFVPVKDKDKNVVDSSFVIMISVKPLSGGIFTKKPESYQVGLDGEVERMSLEDWRSRIIYGVRPVSMPKSVSRVQWNSTKTQKACYNVVHKLVELQNQGKYSHFKEYVMSVKKDCNTVIELFVIAEESVVAYKGGMMKKADNLIAEFEKVIKNGNIDDLLILQFRMLYAKSAIARAKGDYEKSYCIAEEGKQLADLIPPGVFTAWFYNHVAIVEKFLSEKKNGKDRENMAESALNHYIKALQHARASEVEQEFPAMIADLEKRIHIFRAITILGDFTKGPHLQDVTPFDVKAAKTNLLCYQSLVFDGFLPTSYRKNYYLLAECDHHFAQWYQQVTHQQQQPHLLQMKQHSHRYHHTDHQQQLSCHVSRKHVYITPSLLKQAFDSANEARKISKECRFEELTIYANSRLARIAEMMVKWNCIAVKRYWSNQKD